jgi:hypothetical protein
MKKRISLTMSLIELVKEELRVFGNYHTFRDKGIFEKEVVEIICGNKPNDEGLIKCLAELFSTTSEEMRSIIDKTRWNPPFIFSNETLAIAVAIRLASILTNMRYQ